MLPVALAACAVGPNYRPPAAAAPTTSRAAGTMGGEPIDRWWECYGDPALVALVDFALAANGDVAIAGSRIRQARADRRGAAVGCPLLSSAAAIEEASVLTGLSSILVECQGGNHLAHASET